MEGVSINKEDNKGDLFKITRKEGMDIRNRVTVLNELTKEDILPIIKEWEQRVKNEKYGFGATNGHDKEGKDYHYVTVLDKIEKITDSSVIFSVKNVKRYDDGENKYHDIACENKTKEYWENDFWDFLSTRYKNYVKPTPEEEAKEDGDYGYTYFIKEYYLGDKVYGIERGSNASKF